MGIETVAIGAGILVAIAWLLSQAKATPTESLTLELECIGGSLNACPSSSNLRFTGGYTLDDMPIDDTIHIFQFSSEWDANNNQHGILVNIGLTVNGYYDILGTAPSTDGNYYYKAYNDEQSALVSF